jgi:hypothetical protein
LPRRPDPTTGAVPSTATSIHGADAHGKMATGKGGSMSTDAASGGWAAPDGSGEGAGGKASSSSAAPAAPTFTPAPADAAPPGWAAPPAPSIAASSPPPLDPGFAPGAVSYAMYRPGIIVLRPLGFGEILDGGIKALRHNPKVMLGLNSLIVLVSQVVLFGLGYDYFTMMFTLDPLDESSFRPGAIIAFFAGAVVASLILTATSAVTAVSVGRSIIGERIGVGDAWRAAWKRTPTVLFMTLIMLGAATLAYAIILLPAFALMGVNPGLGIAVMLIVMLGVVVGALFLAVKFGIAIPAAVLEKLGPIAALKRSWRLTVGRFWPIAGVLLVASIITGVIQNVVTLPVMVIVPLGAILSPGATEVLFVVAIALASFLGVLISVVFVGGITAIVYTDQRMRREGFDLTLTRAAMARAESP